MKIIMIAAMCVAAAAAGAEETRLIDEPLPPATGWSPIGFAILPGLQFPGVGSDVDGLRLAVTVGHNREVSGIDFGLLGSWTDGELNGLSFSGVAKCCGGAAFGLHVSSVINYASGRMEGVQLALGNSAFGIGGIQVGVANFVSEGKGIQIGLFNMAEAYSGIQVGLVNTAMSYKGVQIGLGNIIGESPLTACILFNAWF